MNLEELKQRVDNIDWFHTIDLGRGVVTPGVDDSPRKLARLDMPRVLSGLSVLDVGAWDGFFSFEAERRGARRVVAMDSYCWSGPGWGTQAGFNLARAALQSKVEDIELDVTELAPERVGTFDLVLFLGVLYHMKHPLLALAKVASVTAGQLILETEVDLLGLRTPALAFYSRSQLNRDPTNWWGPTLDARKRRLRPLSRRRCTASRVPAHGAIH